jgi:AhpD family alkylhydroperoxidase
MAIHLNYIQTDPAAYQAMVELKRYLADIDIPKGLQHLIFLRASQINGCAFCLEMHTREARRDGETDSRLATLSAWRDTPYFTPAERAAFALTEQVTLISQSEISSELETELRAHYTDKQIVQLLMTIIQINSWNRLAITTGMQPPVRA